MKSKQLQLPERILEEIDGDESLSGERPSIEDDEDEDQVN